LSMDEQPADRRSPLRVATFPASALLPFYTAVVERVGERLGRAASVVTGTSFDQFAAGEIDAGFICGLPSRPPGVA
jgi:hypothetical protein